MTGQSPNGDSEEIRPVKHPPLRWLVLPVFILVSVWSIACGKRGAPLPPLPQIPPPPPDWGFLMTPHQSWIWLQKPDKNLDGSAPARIEWIFLLPDLDAVDLSKAMQAWRRRSLVALPGSHRYFLEASIKPGCYVLVLANHRKKYAGPSSKQCVPENIPDLDPPDLTLKPLAEGIQISGSPINHPIRIDRMVLESPEMPEITEYPLSWPWEPYHRINPTSSPWSWVDTDVHEKSTYLYITRYQPEPSPGVRILGPVKVLGPLTYEDTFPPPAPQNLSITERPGEIDLIWDPVFAPDLNGYHVYARTSGKTDWIRLTGEPVTISRWTTSRSNLTRILQIESFPVTIEFRITSLDRHDPPNESPDGTRATLTLDAP